MFSYFQSNRKIPFVVWLKIFFWKTRPIKIKRPWINQNIGTTNFEFLVGIFSASLKYIEHTELNIVFLSKQNCFRSTKMKLFQRTQKYLAILGINPNQSIQKYQFNGRIWIGFFLLGLSIIFFSLFLFIEANNFCEYTEIIYILSGMIVCAAGFTFTIFKMKMLFDIVETSENAVNTS